MRSNAGSSGREIPAPFQLRDRPEMFGKHRRQPGFAGSAGMALPGAEMTAAQRAPPECSLRPLGDRGGGFYPRGDPVAERDHRDLDLAGRLAAGNSPEVGGADAKVLRETLPDPLERAAIPVARWGSAQCRARGGIAQGPSQPRKQARFSCRLTVGLVVELVIPRSLSRRRRRGRSTSPDTADPSPLG